MVKKNNNNTKVEMILLFLFIQLNILCMDLKQSPNIPVKTHIRYVYMYNRE